MPNLSVRLAAIVTAGLLALSSAPASASPPPPDAVTDIDPDRPADEALVQSAATEIRAMRFPVKGSTSYVDTFGACRDVGCSRSHMGADIFGAKLQHIVAAADGWITLVRDDASGTAGNTLAVTDADGWRYLYLHINNDSPGTDDNRNPARWRFAPGIELGTKVYAGQHIAYLGDSGNAETTPSHVHFELRRPDGVTINPDASLRRASHAPPDPRLYVFESLRGGEADDHIQWGRTESFVLACDLDGDGVDEPLAMSGRVFSWKSNLNHDTAVGRFAFGAPGDVPLCGDWNGDGVDTVGVRRGATFYLRDTNSAGPADRQFTYGTASDVPVVGDWNGDGIDTVGVVRGAIWHVTDRLAGGTAARSFRFGQPGDVPIAGDWDGDGIDGPGIRRGRYTMLRFSPSNGVADITIGVGATTDLGFAASWGVGDGDSVSLWRPRPS